MDTRRRKEGRRINDESEKKEREERSEKYGGREGGEWKERGRKGEEK